MVLFYASSTPVDIIHPSYKVKGQIQSPNLFCMQYKLMGTVAIRLHSHGLNYIFLSLIRPLFTNINNSYGNRWKF